MGDPPASPGVRWRIRHLDDIDSTNRYVLDAARAGAPAGLVVVAAHQHEGRGRRGRVWTAPAGSALLVSVLLRPHLEAERVHLVTMAAAIALADAVHDVAGFVAELKWPNDLVVNDRKLAGLLAEVDVSGTGEVRAVVVGIGCNVTWGGLPPEVEATATACDREAGHPIDRVVLLNAFLERFAIRLDDLAALPATYRSRLATLGRAVRVELPSGSVHGRAVDVDEFGRLVVDPGGGAPFVVVAVGDVVHLRAVTDPGSTRSTP